MAEPDAAVRPPLLGDDWANNAAKGLLVLALGALALGALWLFLAVNDIIVVWLESQWVPVWRAAFGLLVIALALYVITRLTGRRIL